MHEISEDDLSNYLTFNIRYLNEDNGSDSDSTEAEKYLTRKRKKLLVGLKNFRRSQIQKANWRAQRYKYLKGIREFTRSVEGKQFHRRLSRYLVSRGILKGPRNASESFSLGRFEAPDFLVSLSSLRTHLFIESRYYQTPSDEVDYFILLEIFVKKLNDMESRIIESMTNYTEFVPTQDDLDFLESVVCASEDSEM
jgi:hypothetical protein